MVQAAKDQIVNTGKSPGEWEIFIFYLHFSITFKFL